MVDASLIQLIGNVGFPIVITIYLLHKFEQKLEKLEAAIIRLTTALTGISEEEGKRRYGDE